MNVDDWGEMNLILDKLEDFIRDRCCQSDEVERKVSELIGNLADTVNEFVRINSSP